MEKIHPRLETLFSVSSGIAEAAELAARSANRQIRRAFLPRRGKTLRPGVDTPLWNALAIEVRSSCNKYGDKARLGRFLGLPRQRVDDFLKGKRAVPDGERVLLLLYWLEAKKRGVDVW